jgi:uncharacterized membrane protein YidH (DUF202 family)
MTRPRDLVSGLALVLVAGWFVVTTGVGGDDPALLIAVVACGLAGVAYLLAGAGVDRTAAGWPVTPGRSRSIGMAVLGVSILALGADGLADGLDALSAVLLLFGGLAALIGLLRLNRVGSAERDPPEEPDVDGGT